MLTAVADEVFDLEGEEEEEEEEEPSCTLDEINEERIWWEKKYRPVYYALWEKMTR